MDIDPIIQIKEVSGLTGVAEGTLRYYASVGKGPKSFKLGKRRVWRKSAVLAWIAEAEAAAEPEGA